MPADEPVDLLRLHLATLHRAGVARKLLEAHGTAAAVFAASRAALAAVDGVTPRTLDRLLGADAGRRAEREIGRCEHHGIRLLVEGSRAYPAALRGLPDMPLVLFCRGDCGAADEPAVGVVGSRRPSPYALRQAARFATRLAERGVTVVSGLARGIDGAAQKAALAGGGRTLAVLGSGLGRIYPPEHRQLAETIVATASGAVLSEFPHETAPRSFHFPQRNRLLSGLSALLLVVEAGERSGSLITVDWALRQGKNVYALPGRVDQPQALGGLGLLRDGAYPAIRPDDLFDDPALRGFVPPPGADKAESRRTAPRRLPGRLGARLTELFGEEDLWHPDALASRLEVSAAELLVELGRLETEGHLERVAGGAYLLAENPSRGRQT